MRRRDLIAASGAIALLAATRSSAQPAKTPKRIGWLVPGSLENFKPVFAAFATRMKELGYLEGRDYVLDLRPSEGRIDVLPALARELLAQKLDLVLTGSSAAIAALKKETTTVPIVFGTAADVVEQGFVASLARPGGNITGVTLRSEGFPKTIQLVREIQPMARRIAIFHLEGDPYAARFSEAHRQPAEALGFRVAIIRVSRKEDFDRAFAEMVGGKADALIVPQMSLFSSNSKMVTEGALKAKLPIYSPGAFVWTGGLLRYNSDAVENYSRVAVMIDKIFKGAKPGDLPVEEPDRFRLIINLKTAKALGIVIPQSVLVRADEVIQ